MSWATFFYYRSKSIASVKTTEVIPESPTEQLEENETQNQNLVVNNDESRIAINSPPPRPSTASNERGKDVQIPVPTPTPTPIYKGKEEHENSKNISENEVSLEAAGIQDKDVAAELPNENSDDTQNNEGNESNDASDSEDEDDSNTINDANADSDEQCLETESLPLQRNFQQRKLSFENMHSKMGDEDVIVDPIKMLEGEGEALKNAEENGRDHYDEGFHSGELVNSEEDSNSIETLAGSEAKEDEKPARTATPMPRSNSFYKAVSMDPESKSKLELETSRGNAISSVP